MKQADVESILLLESHRLIAEAANRAADKFGKRIPAEARADYLSHDEVQKLKAMADGPIPFQDPTFQKAMAAGVAHIQALSYPLDGEISPVDADALESLKLTAAQKGVVERVIGEACHSVLYYFFCLLDSIADPELTNVKQWRGARLSSPRKEGPMLHENFGETFHTYRNITRRTTGES